jgi:hypothetical protein
MVQYFLKYKHIKKEAVNVVRQFWSKGFWTGDDAHQQSLFESLLTRLCEIYQIEKPPHLIILKDFSEPGIFLTSLNIIIMNKFSIITFLHEFKHVKDINEGKRPSEENARGWSLSIIYQVNPNYLRTAVVRGTIKFLTLDDVKDIVQVQCPYCGSILEESSDYCSLCGSSLLVEEIK